MAHRMGRTLKAPAHPDELYLLQITRMGESVKIAAPSHYAAMRSCPAKGGAVLNWVASPYGLWANFTHTKLMAGLGPQPARHPNARLL
jgi:hypothetical protein